MAHIQPACIAFSPVSCLVMLEGLLPAQFILVLLHTHGYPVLLVDSRVCFHITSKVGVYVYINHCMYV